jgi:hypothetical protein
MDMGEYQGPEDCRLLSAEATDIEARAYMARLSSSRAFACTSKGAKLLVHPLSANASTETVTSFVN